MIYFVSIICYEVLFIFHHIPVVITLQSAMGVQENVCESRVHGLSMRKHPFTQHLLLLSKGCRGQHGSSQRFLTLTMNSKQVVEFLHI